MNYTNTALNYTGSKFQLLSDIIPQMDFTKKYFIDLFGGSGVVGFNLVDKYHKILYNDIITDLVGIHKGIIYNSEDFINKVKTLCVDKDDQEGFNKLRSEYNSNNTPEGLYALILCSTNNMMRFSLSFKYNQSFGRRSFNISTQNKLNLFLQHIQPYKNKLYFTSKPFHEIKLFKPSMVYIDPPYGRIQDENGKIVNKQISEAGYNCFWKKDDDINLYNYILELNKNNHSFMVSGLLEHNNEKSWMLNKLINDGFKYKELKYNYNKVSKIGNKETMEIIITNY